MICLPRCFRVFSGLAVFAATIVACQTSKATTFLWNVASPGANNWNNNADWNPNTGNPGLADTAVFGLIGTSPDALTVNNVVSVNTAVTALQYTNGAASTTSFHVTQIPTGTTLSTTNFTETALGNVDAQNTYVTMTGGGTFFANGATFIVGNNAATTGNALATLDLSALNTFIYSNSTASMLIGWNQNRSRGTILFASTSNNVTAGTFSLGVGGSSNGGTCNANLGGGTNILNANTINIIAGKCNGALQFQNAAGGLRIRGAGGTDTDRANMVVGNRTATGTGTTTGNVFLNGHPVDLKFGTLTVGQETGSAAVNGIGVFQFDTGTLDANAINIAFGNANAGASVTGTFTMGGGNLVVGSGGIVMASQTNGTSTATLNLNGGTAQLGGSLRKTNAAGTATVNISSASLSMVSGGIGTPDAPINNLNLTSATLQLASANNFTNVVAVNFNPVDTANIINISSVPVLTGYPSQFPIVSYSVLAGAGSISLGTLPGSFQGYITNDTTLNTVFLVITNGPSTSKTDQWGGGINSTWDTTTLNWTNAGVAVAYAENDSVAFDDTATTGNVNYSTTHTPFSMTFNNSSLNYIFGGTGKISGPSGLVHSGSGTVTLTASGGDNFTGGIIVNAGKVILDGANSAISGGLSVFSSATFQLGNNDSNGNVPSGGIASDGSLIFNRADNLTLTTPITGTGSLTKIGNGVLTFSNANTYSGETLVSHGTLALAGPASLTNSADVNVSGGTLDLSGVASGNTALNALILNNAVLTLGTTGALAPLNVTTTVTMGGSASTINVSALPPIASYPSTVTLIQSVSGISGYNAVLGTLPTASPSYAGTIALSPDQASVQLTLTAGPIGTRASVLWNGSDVPNLNTNWSDRLNWQLPGAPTPADNVVFGNVATVSDAVTVNNIVDANTTVSSLRYTNSTSGQWHVTDIPTGVTLTATNLTIGGLVADSVVTSVAMTDGGTLVATGPSFNVGNNGSSASASSATANFSGLSNFVYEVPTGTFNIGNNGSRSVGNMTFAAASNRVTAATFNFEASAASSSVSGTITLGSGTNIFNVSSNNIGAQRSSGTLQFSGPTGGIRWRGTSGADSDRAYMTLGLRNAGGTSGTSRGRLFFNDHPVDMKLATLIMGQETGNGSPIGADGEIQFTMGTIDVTTINMAIASGNAAATSAGTLTVGTNATLGGNATLIVGTGGVSLVNQTLGTSTGNLNIAGGVMTCSGNIIKTTVAGVGNLGITNGILKMLSGVIGSPAAPIDNLNLDTGTIQLNVNGASSITNIVATTITAANTTTINIGSVSGIVAPVTVSLISYTGADPFPNLGLGTLPAGVSATLVDNTANSTIDLNITAVPASVPPTIKNISFGGGNIVISGTNNAGAGGTFHVLTSTNVALPLSSWSALTNGTFDGSGNFNLTNAIDSSKSSSFYILQVP